MTNPQKKVYHPPDKLTNPTSERLRYALGFTTGDPYADAKIYRQRFEEWRWRTVRKHKGKGVL